MKKLLHLWYVAAVCLVIAQAGISFADTIITVGLGSPLDTNPDPYIVDIPLLEIAEHSEVILLIENIENPMRYKEWELTVWVPQAYAPLAKLDILDYKWGTPQQVLEIPDVPMAFDPTAVSIPGYLAYYADTREIPWYQYGTQPVGAGLGRVDIGNPQWVSFHFDPHTPQSTPVFIAVHDICIPEPATMCVFGVGIVLMLLKKQKAAN